MPDKDQFKPDSLTTEEWSEKVNTIQSQYTDNSEHHTVQIKLKPIIRVLIPILVGIVAIGLYILSQQLQIALSTLVGIIIFIIIGYYALVDETAEDH